MKYLFAFAAVFLMGASGASFLGAKNLFKQAPTTVEATQVKSNTVTGNVVDERLTPKSAPTNQPKTVLKFNVNKSRVLYLTDEVNFFTTQKLINEIKKLNSESSEDIYLQIDSPGGSVIDGALLASEMEASKAHVNTVCTRFCASMAAMLHSYGYKRYGVDRSILMYHPASGAGQGQIPNIVSQLTTITRYMDKMVSNVTSRSKVTLGQYKDLTAYELWVDAEDAVEKNLNDAIVNLNVPSHEPEQVSMDQSANSKRHKSLIPPGEIKMMAPDNELYLWGIEPYGSTTSKD
jgi:ATP-dependent Clp protease protease subunit